MPVYVVTARFNSQYEGKVVNESGNYSSTTLLQLHKYLTIIEGSTEAEVKLSMQDYLKDIINSDITNLDIKVSTFNIQHSKVHGYIDSDGIRTSNTPQLGDSIDLSLCDIGIESIQTLSIVVEIEKILPDNYCMCILKDINTVLDCDYIINNKIKFKLDPETIHKSVKRGQ